MLKSIKIIRFKDLRLANKVTSVLLCVFMGGILLSRATLSFLLNYTNNQVQPELLEKLETKLLPERVPAYSAWEVFEKFHADPSYNDFFIKKKQL